MVTSFLGVLLQKWPGWRHATHTGGWEGVPRGHSSSLGGFGGYGMEVCISEWQLAPKGVFAWIWPWAGKWGPDVSGNVASKVWARVVIENDGFPITTMASI